MFILLTIPSDFDRNYRKINPWNLSAVQCTRFLMRMGQVKILISSHFVHTDRRTHKWTHYNVPEFWYCPMVTVPWPDFEGEKGYFTSILHRLGQGPSGLHADFISSLHWIYLGWNCFSLYFHPKISADQSDHSVYVLKNYHFYRYMPYDL